ncbi:tetratricopeptide repeat protein [Chryseobacterium jejuense]|uniref:tetratricopeptide repeat protein n=1 Tax=Chryseobacterium jejuense TaxID=445960 RepID=UPI001AE71FCE|nr:tetratricopeptide repeat protein [Chryseobacterium jejuense]MBP2619562.1 tetratricopeptide (TPR) repeat protein/DNA-binding CsgD family transcriptional regulator [Chryseobacterium jejuense]
MSIGILWCIVSCNKNSQDKERDKFDSVLIKKSADLQLGGEYEALIELNVEYLKKANKMRYKEGIALCYLNMAEVNISAGNYEKALFFFNKAENDLKNSENGFHKAAFYDDYSLYYSHLKLHDKAITYNSKAFLYLKEAKDSELKRKLLPRLHINKGINYIFKGWYGTSLKSFLKGNALENSAYSNCMVAQYYLFRHQTDSAEVYIKRADEKMLSQKTSDAESLWVYYTMGYYYNEVNNNEQAEKALKKALEINIKTRRTYSSHIQNVYKSLAELYKKKNDGGKAYYYLRKYMEEEGRLDVARLDTMNKATENFISELKPESDWHRSDLPLAIALSITALTVSGIYVQKTIKTQRLRKRALKEETEELKSHVRAKMLKEVTELAQKNDSSFLMKFKDLHPDFINTLLKINPDLENSELTFCAMLKLHFSSKEIADYTFVQHRSVQQKKYRIRKRLNIPGEEDIYVFFDKISS